jgi:hypothetical protein
MVHYHLHQILVHLEGILSLTEPTTSIEALPSKAPPDQRPRGRHILARTLSLLLALGITVGIVIFASHFNLEQLRQYGYPGVFFASLLANATIALPVPGIAVTIGTALALPEEWWLVALVGAMGELWASQRLI